MYSRSLDSYRVPTALPSHYGGSAFRADGTPTPIPVKREYDVHQKSMDSRDLPPLERTVEAEPQVTETEEEPQGEPPTENSDIQVSVDIPLPTREASQPKEDEKESAFLSRLLDGVLPGVREDDLLLLLLILLLSREKGNEDVLVLLAFLLFAK